MAPSLSGENNGAHTAANHRMATMKCMIESIIGFSCGPALFERQMYRAISCHSRCNKLAQFSLDSSVSVHSTSFHQIIDYPYTLISLVKSALPRYLQKLGTSLGLAKDMHCHGCIFSPSQ